MVIVRLMGGLGNQMFQYASARALAHRRRQEIFLDLSAFQTDSLRTYQLAPFRIVANQIDSLTVQRLTGYRQPGVGGFLRRSFQYVKPYFKRSVVCQRVDLGFDAHFFAVPNTVLLIGYWQSEMYFADIAPMIRAEFSLRGSLSSASQAVGQIIRGTNSISIHVRRGDYVSDPVVNKLNGMLSVEYYAIAIERMTTAIPTPHFFVFSDDIAWVRKSLHIGHPTMYIEHNGPGMEHEDLILMSMCRHNITANSSFSWWGAWLNTNPDKIVIAPQTWFVDPALSKTVQDIVPSSWLRIPN